MEVAIATTFGHLRGGGQIRVAEITPKGFRDGFGHPQYSNLGVAEAKWGWFRAPPFGPLGVAEPTLNGHNFYFILF